MRLDGRRESGNVEDRRGGGFSGGKASLGIGGVLIVGLLVWIMGGNPMSFFMQQLSDGTTVDKYTPTPDDEQTAQFAKRISAGTDDDWTEVFRHSGRASVLPKMVLF